MTPTKPVMDRRRTLGALLVFAALVTSTACAREEPVYPKPTIHSVDAKQSIIELVDASTEALGGEWEVIYGPHRGSCSDPTYTHTYGMTWNYARRRVDRARTADRDVPILEALWTDRGLRVARTVSGGERPDIHLVGRGEAARSIGYLDAEFGGITIDGESPCAIDDGPDRLTEEELDEMGLLGDLDGDDGLDESPTGPPSDIGAPSDDGSPEVSPSAGPNAANS